MIAQRLALGALLTGLALPLAAADWSVVSEASSIGFVSVKDGDIAETHEFGSLSGAVGADGAAKIDIALGSVETRVDIRNERMRDVLFQVAQFPIASVAAEIDMAALETLGIGERAEIDTFVTVAANGTEADYDAFLNVTRIGDDRVSVSAREPVAIDVHDFGYEGGVAQLQEIAGLDAISPIVPVTFDIVFGR